MEYPDKEYNFVLPGELEHLENSLKERLEDGKPKTIIDFLDIFTDLVKEDKTSTVPVNNCDKYRYVIRECVEVTKFYLDIKSWDTEYDLSKVKFVCVDDLNREHPLEVKVHWNVGTHDIFEVLSFDLPLQKDSFKPSHTLKEIYEQFKQFIEGLQPFFNLMETLDKHCWILDPAPPQKSFKYRRISIGKIVLFHMRMAGKSCNSL